MKLTLNVLEKRSDDKDNGWPGHVFGGRIRTSTLLLIVAFLAVWWVYDTYRPEPPPKPAAPQIVPPGFVPDPNYTWVPRSRVQEPPTATYTPTPSTTVPPPPTSTVPTTTPPTTTPPFQLPQLPCLLPAPFCPPTSSATPSPSELPQPRPGP
ncbi:hypothetical protein MNAB215_327 [Mycobacterium numidiamassiliense]|jgi:hypothetical protein|uniref:Proline rich protein n=1 Tax=Mycobacterium numidiamassiliense TaxID=1841861 RepID=A0A2U3P310_9MYCO|nr:hypothetical protein [Mycobacterium numidiamassiliense]SPM38151.1 hypothetical protein MNAB215_327 [Mycobacterium numidiamassiliense]